MYYDQIPFSKFEKSVIKTLQEVFLVIGYSLEYGLRVWSAGCRSRYQDIPGRLRFMKQPFNLLDLVICGLSFFLLTMRQGKGNTFAPYALRGLKFLQILRIVRMDRRAGTWKLLGSVVYLHRQELITTFYIGFLGLIFASFVVYQTEKETNPQFSTYADALWWGIVTLTTVGYGDATPKTWPGKLTASFFAIMGISFFALPAGILGSGFALKVQQQQRQKHVARRRQPAASLIQCLWRCYAANEDSLSVATWLIHVRPKHSKDSAGSNHSNRPKKQSSFLNRIQTSRQRKSNPNHNQLDSLTSDNLRSAVGPFGGNAPSRQGSIRKTHPQYSGGSSSRTQFEPSLAHQHSHQYTGSHSNLKESLKISDSKRSSRQGSIFSLQFDSFPNPFSSNPNSRRNSAESEQDEESQMLTKLRPCHKVAIRFVRKLKYFVYRRKFREALKPYDVKDVIEQYAAGHVELLSRVKEIQQRIDIVVGSKDKKKQTETKMTVASRIVKLESQITYLERKLDHLINVYRKDQMRYKRTDTTNSNHDDDDHPQTTNIAPTSSAAASSTVAANQLLAPFYKRDDAKSTMSMNLLSPDQPHDSSRTHQRYKNRSSSQPTSLENLRNLPETTTTSQNNRGGSLMSQKKHSLLPLRTTSIKIPSFLERNSQKSQ
ncbi:potassium voltage-gated channel subfamily KQT member 1-like isoform X2 [Convolutriloba macropyga]|uniref:potassium voltage-gated channel subfamily KQT member 1-like isoform X2 n=1 Tax=Convolutriloba macropyga TaxID=536237 RepID=UPI003F521FCF